MVQALQRRLQNSTDQRSRKGDGGLCGQADADATKVSPKDHEQLRAAGFDDRGILQITLIASWFNYINRVADALGVGRD